MHIELSIKMLLELKELISLGQEIYEIWHNKVVEILGEVADAEFEAAKEALDDYKHTHNANRELTQLITHLRSAYVIYDNAVHHQQKGFLGLGLFINTKMLVELMRKRNVALAFLISVYAEHEDNPYPITKYGERLRKSFQAYYPLAYEVASTYKKTIDTRTAMIGRVALVNQEEMAAIEFLESLHLPAWEPKQYDPPDDPDTMFEIYP